MLNKGNFIGEKVNYTFFFGSPHTFCNLVDLCGPVNLTALGQDRTFPEGYADRTGAVIVRMKLFANVTSIARSSPKWPLFVKAFVSAIAKRLRIKPKR